MDYFAESVLSRQPLLSTIAIAGLSTWCLFGLTGVLLLLVGGVVSLALLFVALWTVVCRTCARRTKGSIGFFHPFADGGGGGERVLWCAINAVHASKPNAKIVIYCRAGIEAKALVQDAKQRFGIDIPPSIHVVGLQRTALLQPSSWPRFTLAGQALASMLVALDALQQFTPHVFVDTSGWAFTFPLAWLAGSKVACYVHYPTISVNMLGRVWGGQATYNNDASIAGDPFKTGLKLMYYYLFAFAYALVGGFAGVVMANSSWTAAHIRRLWPRLAACHVVYPPCDTSQLQQLPLDRPLKRLYLLSVAQFRPEKNHALQLEAFALARSRVKDDPYSAVHAAHLKIVGSCRNADDEARLQQLKDMAAAKGLSDVVEFHVNLSFNELKIKLSGAVGGLHTMVDEHFGICVVEYMAAGIIPIANNSGGPKDDIIGPAARSAVPVGLLASSADEYADAIIRVLEMKCDERLQIAAAARQRACMFSEDNFMQTFTACMLPALRHC